MHQIFTPSIVSVLALAGTGLRASDSPPVVSAAKTATDFALVRSGWAATIFYDPADAKVVEITAKLFADDVQRVSGVRPEVATSRPRSGPLILVGTIGKSSELDALIDAGKVEVSAIKAGWERYRIEVVQDPFPGIPQALVIAGSDRRGTAYGVFSLSKAMGVSPWYWWADAPVQNRTEIYVDSTPFTSKEPSVRYRGIFLNDEDWGLQEWAEKNFESGPDEVKDIGPKTYAKIFELLLRLNANYCWPAMHPSTKAFNHYPQNRMVADDYAIVMGSSHAEPMLRNNVSEWHKKEFGEWNPVTNLQRVLDYWEQRVEANGKSENVWTVGMRGVHDSSMPGGGTIVEKRERLEKIIGFQREMLAKHVNPDPSQVPQIFCPYKEVLDIYRCDLDLPEDITILWPDDNHGYIRQLPNEQERKRPGGHGIYYHISYWGAPHDYLWLESTPPAQIWKEMTKAHQLGVRQLWVLNVGDIKPVEAGITLFLEMAWDIERYGADVQQIFLREFFTTQFGQKHAGQIAELKDEYFRLCAIRRPEHMGFNRVYPDTPVQDSGWPKEKVERFLDRWQTLAQRTEAFAKELPQESQAAYFQLVEYPARAGAAMAEKILFLAEKTRKAGSEEPAQQVKAAMERIEQLTGQYNTHNDGKWHGMMDHRPRGLSVFSLPSTSATADRKEPPTQEKREIEIDPTKFECSQEHDGAGWLAVDGLGPRGSAVVVLPFRNMATARTPREIRERAPVAEYPLEFDDGGKVEVTVEALPTHPFTPEHEVLAAVSVDDAEPVVITFDRGENDEHDPKWKENVLRHAMFGAAKLSVPKGKCMLKLWAADRALVVQQITLSHGGARKE